jgi:LPS sulfotransferase NodH
MRLSQPFHRLSVKFDAARMREEIERIPSSAWAEHPNGIPGNSSIRLISVNGEENDEVNGRMAMTPHLAQSPYLRQILSSFGVVWGRSRLMRLAPGASVPQHADINYHWFTRVRLHIPVITRPQVRFYCGDDAVHMAAGEAWLFDNWRLHRVENPTPYERIHLVADTSGSSRFWQFVARSQLPETKDVDFPYDSKRSANLVTEQTTLAPVMPPAEVELLIRDLRAELVALNSAPAPTTQLARYHALLDNFCKDWRQLYLLHGETESGRGELLKLRDDVRCASKQLSEDLVARTNRVSAHTVLDARVLRPMVVSTVAVRRPVFIVAAPRSGSTLLYETLAASRGLSNLGGEAHWLVESISELQIGAPGVNSNRLTAANRSSTAVSRIVSAIADNLADSEGHPAVLTAATRLLEKTPKNSLRIPFFDSLFPDAQFIFLWREPRGNVSSIIEAWRSGNWKTYNGLEGFDGPWSLILPPDWRSMNGRPLEEIAAFQWETTNRIVLDDLARLPQRRWTSVSYAELLADPTATIERLCAFIDVDVDENLRRHLASPLPLSRYTYTPPARGKWENNAEQVERIMPQVESTWRRLESLRVVKNLRSGTYDAR